MDKLNKNCYIPFGGGRRGCIGRYVGALLIKLFIGNLLDKYQIETVEGQPLEMKWEFAYIPVNSDMRIKLR